MDNQIIIPVEVLGGPITLAFSKDKVFLSERLTGRLWEVSLNFQDSVREHAQKAKLIIEFPVASLIGHHETGLLGIAVDPDFEENRYIYCYYTYGNSEENIRNRVVRIKDDGMGEEILLEDIPAGMIHNGGILAFAPDKTLYIGVGVNNFVKEKAQDINFLGGKILRINRDGSIPKDNPFPSSPVFSLGHRNIFGLAFHPKTGALFACDVGPDHDDEINIIQKGGNYGWPEVVGKSDNPKFINPIQTYTPTMTPTQCVFVGDDFYFSSYNEGTVHKLTLTGEYFDQVKRDEVVYESHPFGIIGVFYNSDQFFYITQTNTITKFKLG